MLDLLTEHVSYLGIIIALVLTGSGMPIPEEVIVIIAGVAAYHGTLNPWLALTACMVGALLGDCVMYSIGYHFGRNVLQEHPWFARFLTPAREKQIEQMIARHGAKVFLFARFLVGLRSPVFLTAGILRVPLRWFILVDTVCATLVIGTFFGLSYLFAEQIQDWWQWIRQAEITLTVAVVAAVSLTVAYLLYRRWQRRQRVRLRRLQRANRAQRIQPVDKRSVA